MNKNMLKIEELRIGNYILKDGLIIQVDFQTFQNLMARPEKYQPIPLSEEWLVKIGFKQESLFIWQIPNTHLYLNTRYNKHILYTDYNVDLVQIENVHELQNILISLVR